MIKFTESDKYKDNLILRLTFEFSIEIIRYTELLDEKRKYSISNQILRSGTSIGANIKEAQNAESKADFIHKFKIALKEADEVEYWLFLCEAIESYPNTNDLIPKLTEIIKISNKIISSSKRK